MNKSDLRNAIAEFGLPKTIAGKMLDEVLETIARGLEEEGVVQIPKFGSFRLKERAARTGRNPQTGEPIEIPARKVVVFRPAKALLERVRG